MNERVEVVQRTSEAYGEEMFDELCSILETKSTAVRLDALREFVKTYSAVELDETGERVMDRANLCLYISWHRWSRTHKLTIWTSAAYKQSIRTLHRVSRTDRFSSGSCSYINWCFDYWHKVVGSSSHNT